MQLHQQVDMIFHASNCQCDALMRLALRYQGSIQARSDLL
jgi:hypothetical protein